jgi:pyridoxine/pyridoxamine 5'-phosphate oxidase
VTRDELLAFLRRHRLAVVATVSASGGPQAAVVGIAVTDALELVFDTLGSTRKAANLRGGGRIALVIGWDEEQTVQLEGVADEPTGTELAVLQRRYFEQFPDGPSRLAWAGITYFRVRPTWIRYSDFRGPEPRIVELGAAELSPL